MTTNLLLHITLVEYWQLFVAGSTAFNHLVHLWVTVMLSSALICFVVSELTHNYSQVDKVWSIMPIIYCLITLATFPTSTRIWLMTCIVTIWGIRLSYNFFRRGGYNPIPWKGEEDYRWKLIRQHPRLKKGIRITLFNLLFISLYQHFLIFLFTTPLLLAANYSTVSLSTLDYLAAMLMFFFILIETIADNQLHIFQIQKRKIISPTGKYSKSLSDGFLSEGLWKYVRHPNFIAEQAIWVSFYFFGVAATGQWINWTLSGPLLLILLFTASSEFTESISLKKYPEYINYKQHVPKFIPLIFKTKKEEKQTT
jgi:steroid 5-alpha reductase family enzyme